jgi:hypothetical protein
MAKREKLPDDLKELCSLCRAGKLFAVQTWIRGGKRYRLPPGKFTTSPLRTAIHTGFHSLVEVLLQAEAAIAEEKDDALYHAVNNRNLDLIELLVKYGAEPNAINSETVFWSRHPAIIRWFIANGMDLESGYPIAKAFANKQREFLGIYMDLRDRIPTARLQAAMALRHHVANGNLKWVSLLLWAGADPRMRVPHLDDQDAAEEDYSTALVDAVRYGHLEIVKKMIDPARDDLTALLNEYCFSPNPELIEFLLSLGADARVGTKDRSAMHSAFSAFEWSLDPVFSYNSYSRTDAALHCIEVLAANGARWAPKDPYRISCLRRALAKAAAHDAIRYLERITKAGAIDQPMFHELMRTPKMKEILNESSPGVVTLRRYAGFPDKVKQVSGQRH